MSSHTLAPPTSGGSTLTRDQLRACFELGLTIREAAERMDANPNDVADLCHRLGIPMIDDRGY